ncbi:unnamed protein product [Tuwongella immobilis]|uniref:Uncharacterized protein n=1 Tax=Tuwongella immobilis TaxID=692036 RepID=A0A6C2YNC5_9BACT|nr:unnamed protein product [Tuwongella immobilis]VTS02719.1 unnamed protein product [Tuwongella immobilis]
MGETDGTGDAQVGFHAMDRIGSESAEKSHSPAILELVYNSRNQLDLAGG